MHCHCYLQHIRLHIGLFALQLVATTEQTQRLSLNLAAGLVDIPLVRSFSKCQYHFPCQRSPPLGV